MRDRDKSNTTVVRTEERVQDDARYIYRLIMKKSRRVASYGIPLYSIDVCMEFDNGEKTMASTKDIFADRDRASAFFDRMVDNLATPIDLTYIVDDEIGV